jgi:hypothetical protein
MSGFGFFNKHRTWEDWFGMLLGVLIVVSPWFPFGLWLIASPLIFGYSGDDMLRAWHVALGAIVVLLGALQLWQDWRLSDQDLANHPQ